MNSITVDRRVPYLGIAVDALAMDDVIQLIDRERQQRFVSIVTPNVDHLVRLNREDDDGLRAVYSNASLVLNDSQVMYFLSRIFRLGISHVTPGSDLVPALLSAKKPASFLVVGPPASAVDVLAARYPQHRFSVHTPPMGVVVGDESFRSMIDACCQEPHDITLVCLGCPVSENALLEVAARNEHGLGIACGAAVDFISGRQVRAPRVFRHLGCEWLFRAANHPLRLGSRYLSNAASLFGLVCRRAISGRLREHDLW